MMLPLCQWFSGPYRSVKAGEKFTSLLVYGSIRVMRLTCFTMVETVVRRICPQLLTPFS
jgi:hypothetical protein